MNTTTDQSDDVLDNVYTLIEPIELKGKEPITELTLTKPTFGAMAKVKAEGSYARGLELLEACTGVPSVILKRIGWDDTQILMEKVVPDFLGLVE